MRNNNYSINKSIEFLLLKNKNSTYKFNRDTLVITQCNKSVFNINGLFIIDFSNIIKQIFYKQNIFYTSFVKSNFNKFNLYLLNCNKIISISTKVPVFEWYERELLEKCSIKISKMFDVRNLLYNYNLKINNNSLLTKNKYNWVYTDVTKKKLKSSNNFRIIL